MELREKIYIHTQYLEENIKHVTYSMAIFFLRQESCKPLNTGHLQYDDITYVYFFAVKKKQQCIDWRI